MNKERILIFEDNMDNYELVRFVLERAGYDGYISKPGYRDGFLEMVAGVPGRKKGTRAA